MTVHVVSTAYGCAALDALASVVAEIKHDDPMAPVTVIAPNNVAGIVARRHLARGGGEGRGGRGIAGIEVTTLARLAERLAAPALAPRRPAARPVVAASWRRALAERPGQFADIAQHPATVRALAEAHVELRDLSGSALRAVSRATAVAADLVTMHESVIARMRDDWYDTTDLLTTAAHQLHGGAAAGAWILYLPQSLTQAEARVVQAMAAGRLTVVVAMTGVKRADEAVERSLAMLQLRAQRPAAIATATRIINSSDSDDEVRCVVRDVVEMLQTTPAHRVAVLYAGRSPYARLLHEHLGAAGVTANGPGVRPADERAVARTLLEILALADQDVPRADLFQALANAPARDFTGARVPVSRWERISRAAGVVSGADWSARLDAYVADRRAQLAAEQDGDEPRQWLIDRLQRDADAAAQLRDFAGRLRAELQAAAAMSTWRELAAWCLALFIGMVGEDDQLRMLPPEEQYAAASVVSLLRGLHGLDSVDDAATLGALRDVLELELGAALPRVGRFGEGVLVAPLSAAIGLDADVVYVVGLSEDLYPGRMHPDALLPERVRQASGGELAASRDRLNAKHRHLLAAFAGAKVESVASFPRGDLRRSTLRLPSRWLLPSLRDLSGDKELPATAWQEPLTYGASLAIAGSFASELLRTTRLATEQEWRVRAAAAHGHLDDAVVIAGVQMIRARAADGFTRYDGNLIGVAGLPDYAVEDRAISPTALEAYAACPHAYFVERLLGVQPIEAPEDIVVISPMQIGNLVHQSVEALVVEFAGSLPDYGQPWSAEQRARFLEIVAAKADEFERRGLTGHPRLWDGERVRIAADARWLLDDDDAWRAGVGARVVASEMPFGIKGEPPVEIAITGGRVLMRGSADRVDQGADGTLYVTDIKTGSPRTFKDITQDDPVVDGTKLQLPVYAYAARARFGADAPVHATYWFVRRERGRRGIDLTADVEQTYAATLSILVGSIANGLFPLRAPESPDFAWVQCPYCNPDGIGHAENRERWERKRHDPALAELVALIEPGVLAEASE